MSYGTQNRLNVDSKQFERWLEAAQLTTTKLGKLLGQDKGTVSRTINGIREMKSPEDFSYAKYLGVSVLDVRVAASLMPPMFGWVREDGTIERAAEKPKPLNGCVSLGLSDQTAAYIGIHAKDPSDLRKPSMGVVEYADGRATFGLISKGSAAGSVDIRAWGGETLRNQHVKAIYLLAPYALS